MSEVATLLFANGFPYRTSDVDRRAAQRAIFVVRREYEEIVRRTEGVRAVLCDRGTLDGLAYWPGTDEEYRAEVGSSRDEELARYTAVIHLRPWMPARREGDLSRREPPAHTPLIEERLLAVWQAPRRRVLEATPDFEQKARDLTTELTELLPPTCFASGE